MKLLPIFLFMAIMSNTLLSAAEDAPLARGVKGEVEDVILVGADDWHASVAATPLAIWSEDNQTRVMPMLILPKLVQAGDRNGWVEESDLKRYGESAILDTFKAANISAIIIHGSGDQVKALVESAHKDGLKVYITATLEIPVVSKTVAGEMGAVSEAEKTLMTEAGLTNYLPDDSRIDRSWLQVPNPDIGGNASYFCPVNPEVRDSLYSQIETLIDDYKADGVVLYRFGFQDENYCFCDVCKEKFYQDTGIDITKVNANSYNQERWNQWKQDQLMQIVEYARNITSDLGPVKLGVALDNPFDRSQGYNFAEISKVTDFSLISPLPAQDVSQACSLSEKPVYVRLSDDYVGYVLSTQNVEGAIRYIEDLTKAGAAGVAFEYNVVHTPFWSEIEPPSSAARWLLQQVGGTTLAVGNVSWMSDSKISSQQ